MIEGLQVCDVIILFSCVGVFEVLNLDNAGCLIHNRGEYIKKNWMKFEIFNVTSWTLGNQSLYGNRTKNSLRAR
jgi:hypothetical protein